MSGGENVERSEVSAEPAPPTEESRSSLSSSRPLRSEAEGSGENATLAAPDLGGLRIVVGNTDGDIRAPPNEDTAAADVAEVDNEDEDEDEDVDRIC